MTTAASKEFTDHVRDDGRGAYPSHTSSHCATWAVAELALVMGGARPGDGGRDASIDRASPAGADPLAVDCGDGVDPLWKQVLAGTAGSVATQRLLRRAASWIEAHVEDEGLRVDALAFALNMSRTSLHRKLVAGIGCSPGELIRVVRLQLARRMLEQGEGNVSEVAYAVGFVSLSGFSRAYRQFHGEPPSIARLPHRTTVGPSRRHWNGRDNK